MLKTHELFSLFAIALLSACSEDAPAGQGGANGGRDAGASGGLSGSGGTRGGFGGSAGNSGSASGGTAGASGSGGTAGASGSGGAAGVSGSGGAAGASGSGGAAGASGSGGTAGVSGSGGTAGATGSGGAAGASGSAGSGGKPPSGDPGTGPWQPVPTDQVAAVCRLDPQKLTEANSRLNVAWAVIRYGKLCYESPQSASMLPGEAWSTTKTFGALVAGFVNYQTRQIARNGRKTGRFSDEDRVDHWLDAFTYNREARVGHVLAMVAHNTSLALGQKTMQYDTIGTTQINTLSDMLNAAIRQDTPRLGADLEQFTQRFVYAPLGMTQSTWSTGAATKTFAYSWSTTVRDMGRVGLLMLHGGMWNGQRLVDAEWIYRMTHPAFEDANTGYGYLTWLNSSSNHHYGGIPGAPVGLQQQPQSPGPCAPVSVYPTHPHGLSDSPNCNYQAPHSCTKQYDVGVWQAVGLGGQVIQGHPGLDLVVVGRELTPLGSGPSAPAVLWDALRPAVIAADPQFRNNETSFCQAYGGNTYAPDR